MILLSSYGSRQQNNKYWFQQPTSQDLKILQQTKSPEYLNDPLNGNLRKACSNRLSAHLVNQTLIYLYLEQTIIYKIISPGDQILGAKALDAFSINWSPTYNYCFPLFNMILKVLQRKQQDKAQAIVVVPYWTTQNWFPVLLGMLVDHPLIMIPSLNTLYLPTHPTTPHPPLHLKLKLLLTHMSGVTSTHKMFLQQQNIYSCPLGETQPGKDITKCCNSEMIFLGGKKPIICYQM